MSAKKGNQTAPEGSCILLLGSELGEKLDALQKLREKLPQGAEETSFYAGETAMNEIVSIIRNGSLFSQARLFIIKNAEQIKTKNDVELFVSYLLNPQSDTLTVLVSEETKIDKRIEDIVSREDKIIFWELFENKKIEWLLSFFRREGCRIEQTAVQTILEMVENNTDALRRECSRLILFLGRDKTLTSEDVERCLSHTREESAFTLFASVARGNLNGAIEIERALLAAKESPQALMASLAWCFRKLRAYLTLLSQGKASDFELRKIGLGSSHTRSDYAEAARRWPSAGAALALLGDYEYLIRSSGTAFEGILMDMLVRRLAIGTQQRNAS
ncbi:MAG: DNA polymerase III subunit delta [Treponema sp.]|nr:DNA polymerase III subunit delta [Treponema sp.]